MFFHYVLLKFGVLFAEITVLRVDRLNMSPETLAYLHNLKIHLLLAVFLCFHSQYEQKIL